MVSFYNIIHITYVIVSFSYCTKYVKLHLFISIIVGTTLINYTYIYDNYFDGLRLMICIDSKMLCTLDFNLKRMNEKSIVI